MSEWPAMDCKVFTSMPDDAASVIYDQLEYEGFTHEQAVYGVTQNGY